MFLVAVSLSVIGQMLVIYFPPLQRVFQTEALTWKGIFKLQFYLVQGLLLHKKQKKLNNLFFRSFIFGSPYIQCIFYKRNKKVFRTSTGPKT